MCLGIAFRPLTIASAVGFGADSEQSLAVLTGPPVTAAL
jgi:hypothetical protein